MNDGAVACQAGRASVQMWLYYALHAGCDVPAWATDSHSGGISLLITFLRRLALDLFLLERFLSLSFPSFFLLHKFYFLPLAAQVPFFLLYYHFLRRASIWVSLEDNSRLNAYSSLCFQTQFFLPSFPPLPSHSTTGPYPAHQAPASTMLVTEEIPHGLVLSSYVPLVLPHFITSQLH